MACTKMLALAVFVTVIGCSTALTKEEAKAALKAVVDTCKTKVTVPEEDLALMRARNPPKTKEGKCLIACIYKSIGIMNEDGQMSLEGARALAEKKFQDDSTKQQNLITIYEKCQKVNDEPVSDGAEGCERAGMSFECLLNERVSILTNFD